MKKFVWLPIFFLLLIGCETSGLEEIPLAPTELKATVASTNQVELSWKDNSTNETAYKIERKIDSGNFTEIGATSKDVTIFSDQTVTLNTTYTYRVYSSNLAGKSTLYSNEATVKMVSGPILTTTSVTEVSAIGAKSGGNITSDGGSPITAKGVVWSTETAPTVSLVTKTSDGTGTGTFQSTLTGLAGNIKYYVRAYATTGLGTTYGEEKVFTTLPENTVVGANGKIWMDRNLGASRVATSSTDSVGFGDLYQWGRAKDGHQLRTSATTATLASVDKPATSDFINVKTGTQDWRNPQNSTLWQGVNGSNNPCPTGFRLPTVAEWNLEIAGWSSNNNVGAFVSSLKLPMAGSRSASTGDISLAGSGGYYWTSTVDGNRSRVVVISEAQAFVSTSVRGDGKSVRCIQN
jgi:uncharacterized protein (TIGR02145 family)